MIRADSADCQQRPRPFLRWAGGKRWALDAIGSVFPREYGTYIEPFVGGGAVYFALQPKKAVISDLNPDLMAAYRLVRDEPVAVSEALLGLDNSRATFDHLKAYSPQSTLLRAVRLIHLNRLSWNGLYRVNSRGCYNVPFVARRSFSVEDAEVILKASKALQTARIVEGDFRFALSQAREGDLVFLDPPYTVTHGDNGFLLYNERIFSWKDQQRLAGIALSLARKGVRIVMTNADHPAVRNLYRDFQIRPLNRVSVLAADAHRRREVGELLIHSAA